MQTQNQTIWDLMAGCARASELMALYSIRAMLGCCTSLQRLSALMHALRLHRSGATCPSWWRAEHWQPKMSWP